MEFTFLSALCIVVGFIIGLGAVTVIDIHGFLGRRSQYWTEATTRTHKITKPLIWIGIFLFTCGFLQSYTGIFLLIQCVVTLFMLINGLFLSFIVSPFLIHREKHKKSHELLSEDWQHRIAVSFVLSVLSWWGSLFLFVYLMVN